MILRGPERSAAEGDGYHRGVDPPPDPVDLREPARRDAIPRFDAEVRDALSVLVGTTALLRSRWHELPEGRRLLLVESLGRRAEELQASLLPVLGRLTAHNRRG